MYELKRDSWVLRIAYGHTNNVPDSVSLCKLFWRTTGMFLFGWPGTFLVMFFLNLCLIFGFGKRLTFFQKDKPVGSIVDIEYWPKILGLRIMPLPIFVVGVILGVIFIIIKQCLIFFAEVLKKHQLPEVQLRGVYIGVAISVAILALYWLSTTDYGKLFKGYIRSLKQKFCPVILIDHDS